ncbi:hypothetical protein H8S44_05355 [Anaerosacchariphilus sp. NSJ-68]|uniref:Uncharacterized protein n=2 Tax=Lachnospiraceae TaxID=186803 RepID=A0A923LAV9_9FIRM|nr:MULTISPECIES: hypothetical protein [Lachnospiraceae]MBC5659196.1 hypothetical protein [Anaerosacchariphilus hominis]MBC5696862.1 hypothetical protein [Roseburia difficilis]
MFPALNMELEIVRTVLKNQVNDIYVCTDTRKDTGVFYTMVSIHDKSCRKLVTEKLNTERLFFSNRDFIGSFIYENRLNLVFRYYHENLLSLLGSVYLAEFTDCKRAALGLIAACAECGAGPELGALLLNDRNINVTREGEVQFNYFLDFAELEEGLEEPAYLQLVAEKVFGILELNYKGRYETPDSYPGDLRLFYMKLNTTGFSSLGHMIAAVRSMPDKPVEMRGLLWWIRSRFRRIRGFLFRNSMSAFLTILVVVTLIYGSVQVWRRWTVKKAYESNVSYNGIEYIGNVYLGEEE